MAFTSNINHIDALLDGISFTGTTGQAATVSYSFIDSPYINGTPFTESQRLATLQTFDAWSSVANISFVVDNSQQGLNANLLFAENQLPAGNIGITHITFQGSTILYANITTSPLIHDFTPGQVGFLTVLHEVGHGLGLGHPANYSGTESPPFLPVEDDSIDLTVMSYFEGDYAHSSTNAPVTPMLYDIAAIQYLYGANKQTHNGNDTHFINENTPINTIWDGGGVDTLDSQSFNQNAILDLREGKDYVTSVSGKHLWIAFNANIENAISGSGNDLIHGNALNNQLTSSAGLDVLNGYEGNDELQGNQGNDTLFGGTGNDVIRGGKDNDYINGNQGADILYGNLGHDKLFGGKDNDFVQGNQGADTLKGNLGNDTVRGGQGDDTLYGNEGEDTLYGDKGNDFLTGGEDSDLFIFTTNSGHDHITDFLPFVDHLQFSQIDADNIASHIQESTEGAIIVIDETNSVTLDGVSLSQVDVNDILLS